MKKTITFLFSAIAAIVSGVTEPSAELVTTSTNLVMGEQMQVSLVLKLPPLPGDYAAELPILNQHPPHFMCSFLDAEWGGGVFDRGDLGEPLVPENTSVRDRRGPVFTLNNYCLRELVFTNPRPFPFTVAREADKGWRLTFALAPWRGVKSGTVRFDPVTVEMPLITGVRIRRDPFNHAVPEPEISKIVLHTKPLTLTVSEPPAAGRPASWCGAVSSDLTVAAKIDAQVCTVGDPMTLTLEIDGALNPSSVRPPDFSSALTGTIFRIDAASLKTERQGTLCRYAWRMRSANRPGTAEFPSLPVSYYDVGRRAYVTRMTDSIPIQVNPIRENAAQQEMLPEDDEEFPYPDGVDLDPRGAEAHPLLPHLVLAALLFLVPPVLFLCIRLAPPVRRRIAARNLAYRRARAFRACQRALRSRNAARRAGAISRFFTVRYGVNGAAVTAADAQRLMAPDYSEADIALIVSNLQTHDAQTYSAKPDSGVLALLLVAGLSLVGGAAQDAADPARAEFYYRRASALAVQAVDEAGFAAAANSYRDCLEAGADNACIYQNLGACLMMAGDTDRARVAFECAERRTGETPSTVRGLKATRAKETNNPHAELSPARIFLRPHVLWNVDVRLLCAAALWAVFWMALLLPAGLPRRFLLLASIVAFCAAAASVGVSLVEERQSAEVLHAQD